MKWKQRSEIAPLPPRHHHLFLIHVHFSDFAFVASVLTSKQSDLASCYFLHVASNPAERKEKQ